MRFPALLIAVLAACSAKAPASGESPRATPDFPQSPPTTQQAANDPPLGGPANQSGKKIDPREATLSEAVLELLEQEHLLHKRIDDSVSRDAFAMYLDRLDGSKMFLLKSDRDELGKYTDKIDDELRAGSLELAHVGEKMFTARVAMIEKWVAEFLAQPLDHSDQEFIELDPKKVDVATTEQELKDRWRRRLELEVLERVAQMEARLEPKKPIKAPHAGGDALEERAEEEDDKSALPVAQIPKTPEAREAKARGDLAKSYAARFTRLQHPGPYEASADLVNAIAQSLDPHTDYLPPADKANFDIHMSGSLEGIGAVLREKDDYIEILEIVPGGAAWRQGQLDPGDLILSVMNEGQDPVDVVDMRIDDVVKMIRGPKGTKVRLRVQKQTGIQETVAITRDVVVVEETYARGAVINRKGAPPYGYIHLPSFYGGKGAPRDAAKDVKHLLKELKDKKVAGVILDIRSNGGGLLGDAIEMTGSLIDQGPVVQVQDNKGKREVLSDDDGGVDYDGPLIVMVDRFSASASEILAGALQDYHRAVIVGTGPTHGKGTVQTLADLDRATGGQLDLGVLKLTIQQFFRVSGASTQREGVSPDVVLPDPAGYIESGERTLDHAIPWSQIPAAKHDDWPATWKPAQLAEKSTVRVAKQPVFAKLATMNQLMKARKSDTKVPLQLEEFMKRRKQQRDELDAATPDLKAAPARFGVVTLDDPAPVAPAGPNGKKDDRLAKWKENLAKDPWVDECVNILGDIRATAPAQQAR